MHPLLLGRWSTTDSQGMRQSLLFHRNGTAQWTFEVSGRPPEVLDLRYLLVENAQPYEILDLYDFHSGALYGKVLYGILDIQDPLTMRFAHEPGDPGKGEETRPSDFKGRTLTYRRE